MSNLSGLTAAITGGAGELCGRMAEAIAAEGVNVVILDIAGDKAAAKAESIVSGGGKAIGLPCDVLSRDSLMAVRETITSKFGGLHILINGAGGNHPEATTNDQRTFFQLPSEAIRRVFDLNIMGTILPCQVLGELILETVKNSDASGNIINISSMNAFRPLTRIPAYSAAKAAVSNFTQWLAVHMSQNYTTKIRVNALAPGFFLTNQNRFLLTDEKSGEFTPRGKTILAHTPAGELGKSDDLISALLWLLDPASRFVNGIVVPIDGGFSAFSGV